MSGPLTARTIALNALFFIPGAIIASWVTRIPDIRDRLGASTAEMGLVLAGLSVGSMCGILCAGALVAALGGRRVVAIGMTGILLSLPTIGLGAATQSSILVATGLFLFGIGMGSAEVAMNVEGAQVEAERGHPFLPTMHGFFSVGMVVGALIGAAATAARFSVAWHLTVVAGVALVVVLLAVPRLPAATGRTPRHRGRSRTRSMSSLWRDPILLLIGVVILAMALAEGTANDWLPLVMVDGHGFSAALGSTIYVAFAAAMAVGRFAGGWFIERFGRATVLCASAVMAAIGIAGLVFVENPFLAAAAVLFWGLGASLGFPVAISAAGDSGPDSAARVSVVATVGYLAFLVGPPALGFVGEEFGLRSALIIPLVMLIAAAFVAAALGRKLRTTTPT